MTEDRACELLLKFGSSQAIEDAELDRLARRFNLELQNENIDSELALATTPEETKSAIGAAIGALAVKIVPNVLPLLIERIRQFLARSPNQTVKVKIQLGDRAVDIEYPGDKRLSTKDVSVLIEALTGSVSRTRTNA